MLDFVVYTKPLRRYSRMRDVLYHHGASVSSVCITYCRLPCVRNSLSTRAYVCAIRKKVGGEIEEKWQVIQGRKSGRLCRQKHEFTLVSERRSQNVISPSCPVMLAFLFYTDVHSAQRGNKITPPLFHIPTQNCEAEYRCNIPTFSRQ